MCCVHVLQASAAHQWQSGHMHPATHAHSYHTSWPVVLTLAGSLSHHHLPLTGADSDALYTALGYLYTGEAELTPNNVINLFDAASKLEVCLPRYALVMCCAEVHCVSRTFSSSCSRTIWHRKTDSGLWLWNAQMTFIAHAV